MPSETLSAPTIEPETPSLFDAAQCARAWLQAAADTDGMLPWAWTPTTGRTIRHSNTATRIVESVDPGQWWERTTDLHGENPNAAPDTWQPTSWPQIRAQLNEWGQAHTGFDEHPGRADATSRHAFQWLRAHATHGHADAGPEQYGRPPTSWAQRGADGQLAEHADVDVVVVDSLKDAAVGLVRGRSRRWMEPGSAEAAGIGPQHLGVTSHQEDSRRQEAGYRRRLRVDVDHVRRRIGTASLCGRRLRRSVAVRVRRRAAP